MSNLNSFVRRSPRLRRDGGKSPDLRNNNKISHQPFTKRHQAYFYQLKMLAAKGDTNDSEVQQYAEDNMRDGSPQSAAEQPDDVEDCSKATCIIGIAYYLRTKRCQHYKAYLKTLQAEGYPYNGEA